MPIEIVTSLEMTSPTQIVPGREPPEPLTFEQVGQAEAALVRATYVKIGAPHGWVGRTAWSDEQWQSEIELPEVGVWIARVGNAVAGSLELDVTAEGDAGIVVFGLLPAFVGKGFGGALLTLATRMAWGLTPPGGGRVRRVWVQTSSRDHPHAIQNYKRRGYRTFRIEQRSLGE